MTESVNHPKHYTSHPSGIEAITVCENLSFNLGNTIKYIWRSGLKDSSKTIEDLNKSLWYLEREILRFHRAKEKKSVKIEFHTHNVIEYENKYIIAQYFDKNIVQVYLSVIDFTENKNKDILFLEKAKKNLKLYIKKSTTK